MVRLAKALVLALGAAALLAGSASAASPIDLGAAEEGPHLALNPAGEAVATFSTSEQLHYCSLAPGGTGCHVNHTFSNPSGFTEGIGNWPLIPGAELLIESRRDGLVQGKFLYEGPTDSIPTTIADDEKGGGPLNFTEAAFAPANSINTSATVLTVAGTPITEGATLAASGITTSTTAAEKFIVSRNVANTGNVESGDATVAVQGPLASVAYVDQSEGNQVLWRRLVGTGNPAFIQDNAHWSAPAVVGTSDPGGPVRMVSGPHGLYIAYPRVDDSAVVLQKFNGFNGFEAPLVLTPRNAKHFDIYEDSAGLIHLVYENSEDGVLHYTYAKDGSNTTFSNPQTLVSGNIDDLRTVVNANGQGWVTWLQDDFPNLHAVALELQPGEPATPPPPAPPAPGGGGNKSGGSGGGPTTTISKSLGHGLVGQLSLPKGCVAGGSVFSAKLAVKAKGSKAKKLSYTVKKVKFSAGGKSVTDKKKPFTASFVAKGKSLTVAAAVKVNLHLGGKRHSTITKTLTAKVTTCG